MASMYTVARNLLSNMVLAPVARYAAPPPAGTTYPAALPISRQAVLLRRKRGNMA